MTVLGKGTDPTGPEHVARAPAMATPDQPSDLLYLDDRELARRTPIRRITWQTWRRQGAGPPFYKVRRRRLYRWDEVVSGWRRSGSPPPPVPIRGPPDREVRDGVADQH